MVSCTVVEPRPFIGIPFTLRWGPSHTHYTDSDATCATAYVHDITYTVQSPAMNGKHHFVLFLFKKKYARMALQLQYNGDKL